MTVFDIWCLAFALAADCFTVSLAVGVVQQRCQWRSIVNLALWFGFFQGAMPLLGWWGTDLLLSQWDTAMRFISAGLLTLIGIKMLKEGLGKREEHCGLKNLKWTMLASLALATSIDALVAGVAFASTGWGDGASMNMAVLTIGGVAAGMSGIGYGLGLFLGKKSRGIRMEIVGGALLILMGLKMLL